MQTILFCSDRLQNDGALNFVRFFLGYSIMMMMMMNVARVLFHRLDAVNTTALCLVCVFLHAVVCNVYVFVEQIKCGRSLRTARLIALNVIVHNSVVDMITSVVIVVVVVVVVVILVNTVNCPCLTHSGLHHETSVTIHQLSLIHI